jgi:hypothetical protein
MKLAAFALLFSLLFCSLGLLPAVFASAKINLASQLNLPDAPAQVDLDDYLTMFDSSAAALDVPGHDAEFLIALPQTTGRSCACGCTLSPSGKNHRAQFTGWSSLGTSTCSPAPVSKECQAECSRRPQASLCNPQGIVASCLNLAPNAANVTALSVSFDYACFCSLFPHTFIGFVGFYWATNPISPDDGICHPACAHVFKYPNQWNSTKPNDFVDGVPASFSVINHLLPNGQTDEIVRFSDFANQYSGAYWPTVLWLQVWVPDPRPVAFAARQIDSTYCNQEPFASGVYPWTCDKVNFLASKTGKPYFDYLDFRILQSTDTTTIQNWLQLSPP